MVNRKSRTEHMFKIAKATIQQQATKEVVTSRRTRMGFLIDDLQEENNGCALRLPITKMTVNGTQQIITKEVNDEKD